MHQEHLYSVGLKHAVSWSHKEPALFVCWQRLPRVMIHVMYHLHMCASKLSPFG